MSAAKPRSGQVPPPRPFELLDKSVVELTGAGRDAKVRGPDRESDCPCGSRRRTRSCHGAPDGNWLIPAPGPLLSGPRTGYAHPKCIASGSHDCSEQISREHWLSANIQRELASAKGPALVSGAAWLHGATKPVGANALASKILCARHNGALSPLDSIAGDFFRGVRDAQEALALNGPGSLGPADDYFLLANGPLIELWLLKLFLGGVASKTWSEPTSVRSKPGVIPLHEILWRGAPWPTGWGLNSTGHLVDPAGSPNSIGIVPWSKDAELWGGTVEIGALNLNLALGAPDKSATIRPGCYYFERIETDVEMVVALAWPEDGHKAESYRRLE